jgi:hypothetical protein
MITAVAVMAIATAFVLAVLLMQGREYRRQQSLAYTNPGEVFALHARPLKNEFASGEEIVILCDLVNMTRHQLAVPELFSASLTVDDVIIASGSSPIGHQHLMEPGETLTKEIRMNSEFKGKVRQAQLTFYGYAQTTDSIDPKDRTFSRSIAPGAPVLRSEVFDIHISASPLQP